MDPTDTVVLDLDDVERRLLLHGVNEWCGPAKPTEEIAVAMGFKGVQDLFDSADRLTQALRSREPLAAADWLRVLLATEIVFASNAMGSGLDWSTTTGMSDEETIIVLRRLQRKLGGFGHLLGVAFGTRLPR